MTDSNTQADANDGIIRFPNGLLGFPDAVAFRLVEGPAEGLFWLVAADGNGLRFLLSDPFLFFDGYSLVLNDSQTEKIGAERASDVAVLAITVPGSDGKPWTANLRGPVVINIAESLGAQLILTDETAELRRPFVPELSPVAA